MQCTFQYKLSSDEDTLLVPDAPQGFLDGRRDLKYL